jgi:hypothetical protein
MLRNTDLRRVVCALGIQNIKEQSLNTSIEVFGADGVVVVVVV